MGSHCRVAVLKLHDESNWEEQGCVSAHGPRLQSFPVKMPAWSSSDRGALHSYSQEQHEWIMGACSLACVQLDFSALMRVRILGVKRLAPPTVCWVSPHQLKWLSQFPMGTPASQPTVGNPSWRFPSQVMTRSPWKLTVPVCQSDLTILQYVPTNIKNI